MTNTLVDIIIPVWNNLYYTKLCIESIYANTAHVQFRLFIINNASTDDTKEYLDSLKYNNLHIHHSIENLGWVKGCNIGLRIAKSLSSSKPGYYCFMNNDVIVSPDWLSKMISTFKENTGAVGPTSNAVSGRQHITYNKPNLLVEEASYLIGFCLLIKAEVVDLLASQELNFMDERFGIGGSDDLDISIRIKQRGYTLLIDRSTYIHHFCSKSFEKITSDVNSFHKEKYGLLLEKWGQETIDTYLGYTPKIYIVIPSNNGDINYKTMLSLLNTNIPYTVTFECKVRMMPDLARNIAIEEAIAHGFDYIWFVDDDMCWDDKDILIKLVNSKVDIVGVQAHTRLNPYFICVFKDAGELYESIDCYNKGIVEVDAIGASCLLVTIDTLKNMSKPWFKFKDIRLLGIDKQKVGEDIGFCVNAKLHGYKIHCNGDIEIGHIGLPQIVTRKTWEKLQSN